MDAKECLRQIDIATDEIMAVAAKDPEGLVCAEVTGANTISVKLLADGTTFLTTRFVFLAKAEECKNPGTIRCLLAYNYLLRLAGYIVEHYHDADEIASIDHILEDSSAIAASLRQPDPGQETKTRD
ncbi:MAG: hypothetical protein ACLP9D_08480 [Candidatus Bathyarchaeia archaeon]